MEEIEVKFLDIDVKNIEKKLLRLGAKKVAIKNFKRVVFDFPGWPMDKRYEWLRLRTDGKETTLTFKRMQIGKRIDEYEVGVSNFDKTRELLHQLGLIEKRYQENKRVLYNLDGVEVDIDYYPLIPAYLEVEAPTKKKLKSAIEKLGFNVKDGKIFSAKQVFEIYGIDEDDYQDIRFDRQIRRKNEKRSMPQLLKELKEAKTKIRGGEKYVHYKHIENIYKVLEVGFIESTEEVSIVYQAMFGDKVTWVRPINDFLAKVKLPNGTEVARFSKVK